MKEQSKIRDADMRKVEPALRRAAAKALELGLRTGTPVWIMRDNKLVDLAAEVRKRQDEAQAAKDGNNAGTG